jgi:hypothetical protein
MLQANANITHTIGKLTILLILIPVENINGITDENVKNNNPLFESCLEKTNPLRKNRAKHKYIYN